MDKAEGYRTHASRARCDAENAKHQEDKALFLKLAHAWLDLAEAETQSPPSPDDDDESDNDRV